ncbi:MAG: ThuA domain-containing protein [Planctomycetes bacterium]|nr:ThuA domain-containing protein [Planctomycetota bacterium]
MFSANLPRVLSLVIVLGCLTQIVYADNPWVVYEGKDGPGAGKHIVLIAGDEEYRSEEALPMLGQILAVRHGFKCTVLFSINPEDGTIDPNNQNNIPGLQNLADADMMIIATRFRQLPDDQMKYIVDFVNSGKPIMGLRTATHAFAYKGDSASPYAKYSFRSPEWPGGFGQQVLGETWINHHGHHKFESTRGVINTKYADHPILKGVHDIWGPTDVYGIKNLTDDAKVLVFGQVLEGMKPTDKPVEGAKNDPMMPVVWTRQFKGDTGKTSTVICTTMGASVDLQCEDLRRLLVNACYWALGLEDKIPDKADVDYVTPYEPSFYGFGEFKKGMKPSDYAL